MPLWQHWLVAVIVLGGFAAGGWMLVAQQDRIHELEREATSLQQQVEELSTAHGETREALVQVASEGLDGDMGQLERDLEDLERTLFGSVGSPSVETDVIGRLGRDLEALEGTLFGPVGPPPAASDVIGQIENDLDYLQSCTSRLTSALQSGVGAIPRC